jgi:hypothetical protein
MGFTVSSDGVSTRAISALDTTDGRVLLPHEPEEPVNSVVGPMWTAFDRAGSGVTTWASGCSG